MDKLEQNAPNEHATSTSEMSEMKEDTMSKRSEEECDENNDDDLHDPQYEMEVDHDHSDSEPECDESDQESE